MLEVKDRKRMRGDGAGLEVPGKESLQAGDPNVKIHPLVLTTVPPCYPRIS